MITFISKPQIIFVEDKKTLDFNKFEVQNNIILQMNVIHSLLSFLYDNYINMQDLTIE